MTGGTAAPQPPAQYLVTDVDEMTAYALAVLAEVRSRLVADGTDPRVVDGYATELLAEFGDEDVEAEGAGS